MAHNGKSIAEVRATATTRTTEALPEQKSGNEYRRYSDPHFCNTLLYEALFKFKTLKMRTEIQQQTIYITTDNCKFLNRLEAEQHERGIPFSKYYQFLENTVVFEVTKEHLKLAKRLHLEWTFLRDHYSNGYLYSDSKRPYGNTDIIGDIGEILGIKPDCVNPKDKSEKWFSDEVEEKFFKLHMDMRVVTQILLYNLSLKIGKYKRESYTIKWRYVG